MESAEADDELEESQLDEEGGGDADDGEAEEEDDVGQKRQRSSALVTKKKHLDTLLARQQTYTGELEELESEEVNGMLRSNRRRRMVRLVEYLLPRTKAAVEKAEQAVVMAADAQTRKEEVEAKKRQRAAEESESKKPMSKEGVIMLVRMKLQRDVEFNNTCDKVDSVWDHIHADFMDKVSQWELPASDGRSKMALVNR